ncbi:EamA family transporter [Sanguibacter sp. A247]|uniref:EamA family transporter n=1 Tax=unclassified Sanguibacter TaxID=2645534 RepID=UPI003FD831B4
MSLLAARPAAPARPAVPTGAGAPAVPTGAGAPAVPTAPGASLAPARPAPQAGPSTIEVLPASVPSSRDRAIGIGLMLVGTATGQTGAALGAKAFPLIGPVGVVALRQLVTAAILVPAVRPRVRGRNRAQWLTVLGLVLVFSVMNLTLYLAVERLGLGLAVTIEFLGPLAVAIFGSRKRLDLACAVLAGVGVVVLTMPGPTTDVVGLALALTAAAAWGAYILLNRAIGQRFAGLEGPALASGVTALLWLPIAAWWFAHHALTWHAFALAAGCAVLASLVPYVVDVLALRRVSAPAFGTFASLSPVWAALMGWLVLSEALAVNEWVGIGLIVASNAVTSAHGLRSAAH